MPTNVIISADTHGIKGYDSNGELFGIYHGQIGGLEKVPSGCRIRLMTEEAIPLDLCYNRVGSILKDASGR